VIKLSEVDEMVEIECLACGKIVKLPQFIDTDDYDYDGQIVCQECKSLLYVKLLKGKVRKYKLIEKFIPPSVPITHVETIKDYGSGQQIREGDKSKE